MTNNKPRRPPRPVAPPIPEDISHSFVRLYLSVSGRNYYEIFVRSDCTSEDLERAHTIMMEEHKRMVRDLPNLAPER